MAALEDLNRELTRGCAVPDTGEIASAESDPSPADRLILYVAHPLGAPDRAGLDDNVRRAMRWLSWLRRSFPETTFIAPWIAAVLSGEDDADPAQREAGLVDADAVVARCDGVVLCGGRVSSGMARERDAARRVWDLTWCLGPEAQVPAMPRYPWLIWASESEVIVEGRLVAAEYSRQTCVKSSITEARCEQIVGQHTTEIFPSVPGTGAEILRRFDIAEALKLCCRRIGESWCYLDAGHNGMCITATQRPLPASDFGPRRANR